MADPDEPKIYHVHTHPSGAELWRHIIEIVAFIVAAGWAFYIFVYQERIKPADTAPQVQFNVNVIHQPTASGAEFVSLIVEMRNVGSIPFKPAGFAIAAYGYRYLPKMTRSVFVSMRRNVVTLRHSLAESAPDLLQSTYTTFAPFGSNAPSLLRAGGQSTGRFGFGIPRNKYDGIYVKYKWCYVWANNDQVYNPHAYRDKTGAYWFAYFPANIAVEHVGCGQNSRQEFPL